MEPPMDADGRRLKLNLSTPRTLRTLRKNDCSESCFLKPPSMPRNSKFEDLNVAIDRAEIAKRSEAV
jgi:hypothetical protein